MTIDRLYKLIFAVPFAIVFASFFFPEFFPWSRRDFTIPTENAPVLEEDRYGVWRLETRALLQDTTVFWKRALKHEGIDYAEPALSFMFAETQDACGTGRNSETALYCLDTQEVVVDTAEYQSVSRQVGRRNHIAIAYSFAHQIGHHVQHMRGILKPRAGEDSNAYARRIELQADCYAGHWFRSTVGSYGEFDFADIYAIQKQFFPRHQGTAPDIPKVLMETRDYADQQERTDWIRKGYRSTDPSKCDTSDLG